MPKLGFPRTYRIAQNSRIREIFRQGKKLSAPFAGIFFHRNGLSHARLCVSIGKKQVAKAVHRNQLKRLVRESFRQHRASLPAVDIVVIIYKSYVNLEPSQRRKILDQQWQRLKIASPASVLV